MKFELLRNLTGNEILGETLYADGKVLLSAGTKITKGHMMILKQKMIFSVRIVDNSEKDSEQDKPVEVIDVPKMVEEQGKIVELKETTLEKIPEVFNGILSGVGKTIRDAMVSVDSFVDTIINEEALNTNLYEIKEYDDYTYSHSVNTGIMAMILGAAFHMNKEELHSLGVAGMLHDIGKTKIDSETINKNGPLTDEELEQIKLHPSYGYDILRKAGIRDEIVLNTVMQHHERVDGSGYPKNLRGKDISLYAKIVAVCDVFTALSANRSYRNRFNPNEAYEYIIGGMKSLFDGDVVNKFKDIFAIYPIGCEIILSDGNKGQVVRQNKGFPDRPVININYDVVKNEEVEEREINLLQAINLTIIEVA